MTWRTNALAIAARSLFRRSGAKRLLLWALPSGNYEDRFRASMLTAIEPGDCVWDVGANVGVYSREFAELVGDEGRVVCFEPSQVNAAALRRAIEPYRNASVLELALGSNGGVAFLQQGQDVIGATSRILSVGQAHESGNEIRVAVGDELVKQGIVPAPNVIKVDTEGFELEVLQGLRQTIASPAMRTVCVEVHFGLLAQRGTPNAPAEVEALLGDAGLSVLWTDPSHIVAQRRRR